MIIENLSAILFTIAAVWFFGGLLFFAWIYDRRLLRFIKKTIAAAKAAAVDMSLAAMLLAPFLIPISVTALCLYFG